MRHPWIKAGSIFGSQTFKSLSHDASSSVVPGFLLIYLSFICRSWGQFARVPVSKLEQGSRREGVSKGTECMWRLTKLVPNHQSCREMTFTLHSVMRGSCIPRIFYFIILWNVFPKEKLKKPSQLWQQWESRRVRHMPWPSFGGLRSRLWIWLWSETEWHNVTYSEFGQRLRKEVTRDWANVINWQLPPLPGTLYHAERMLPKYIPQT